MIANSSEVQQKEAGISNSSVDSFSPKPHQDLKDSKSMSTFPEAPGEVFLYLIRFSRSSRRISCSDTSANSQAVFTLMVSRCGAGIRLFISIFIKFIVYKIL